MLSTPVHDAEREVDDRLVTLFAQLRTLEPGMCTAPELRAAASGLRAVRSWVDAAAARVLVALADTKDGKLSVAEVLDDEGVSARERRNRRAVADGVGLASVFGDALEVGWISADHVAALARVRNRDAVPDAAAGLLDQARGVAPEEFARRLDAWDDALDADNGASADAVRHEKSGVTFSTRSDGMGVTNVVLAPAEHAMLKDAVLQFGEELWRNSGDKESTLTQRHADALLEIVTRATRGSAAAGPAESDTTREPKPHSTHTKRSPEPQPSPNRPSNLRPTLLVMVNELDLRSGLEGHRTTGSARTADGTPLSIAETRRLACTAGIIPVVMNGAGSRPRRRPPTTPVHRRSMDRPHRPRPRLRLRRMRRFDPLHRSAPLPAVGARWPHRSVQPLPRLQAPPSPHPRARLDHTTRRRKGALHRPTRWNGVDERRAPPGLLHAMIVHDSPTVVAASGVSVAVSPWKASSG